MTPMEVAVLFETPRLDDVDLLVLEDIDQFRRRARFALRDARRWTGVLRRNLLAKAIQGSNSIEGYVVNDQDAVAAVAEDEPLSADERTWAEIQGYRSAMTYVLQLADDPDFVLDQTLLRSLHYMMLAHDMTKSPGRYRTGTVYVVDEERGEPVYEAPPAELIGELMAELVDVFSDTRRGEAAPDYVRAAMAHLDLVMIHPFRDGNGRMARCLQTLLLAGDGVLTPEFCSVEEFLGRNTPDYYAVLAAVGAGSWNPANDAAPWVRFMLRAHHVQAQTVLRRLDEIGRVWQALDDIASARDLPERTITALYDATIGLRVRRSAYMKQSGVEARTATRDLQALVDASLLVAEGERRGRTYIAGAQLARLRSEVRRSRRPIEAPYGDLRSLLTAQGPQQPKLIPHTES